jgi:hypothetical protein
MEGSNAWWPLEGSIAWWPLEGSIVWWPMEGKGEAPFPLFPFPPNKFYINLHFFH